MGGSGGCLSFISRATPSAAGPFWPLWVASCRARCLHFEILGDHFSTLGAPWGTILAPRGHPGRLWEQQDGLEAVNNKIFADLGMISGPVCVSFWISKYLKMHFCSGVLPGCYFYRFLIRNFNVWDFQIKVFAWIGWYCKNRILTEIVF